MEGNAADMRYCYAGHPAGYGTFEIMRIEDEKKGTPNLETVHKVLDPNTLTGRHICSVADVFISNARSLLMLEVVSASISTLLDGNFHH